MLLLDYFIKSLIIFLLVFFSGQKLSSQITYEDAFPNLNFEFTTEIQNANDGSNRLFVVEQSGKIKVFPIQRDVTLSQVSTFIDISTIVGFSSGQERGLLGLAFHPNYINNGYFYTYYTQTSNLPNVSVKLVLDRYKVSSSNNNLADSSSRTQIFSFDKNQINSNHNGGKIAFGPDGFLYISIGDGGGGGDPQGNGQNLNTPFGSILRIDIDLDGNNTANGNYEIPSSNPRVGQSGLDELYAWGIRNTWKFSFDSNTLWGADVGQGDYEEINIITIGGNYGWNRYEANSDEETGTSLVTTPDIKPIFNYSHSNGDLSITGGYVYRGSITDPIIQGKYIYGDFVTGRVWALDYNTSNGSASSELLFNADESISSFGLDESGELYFSDYGSAAQIYKINGTATGPIDTPVNGVGVWSSVNSGINGIVQAIKNSGDNMYYIGGEFTNAGGVAVSNLASYSPSSGWSTFGSGTNGRVNAIAVASNGDVYVGGDFTQIGGVTASHIAVWNGTNWSALGIGTNGPVAKIGIDSNDLVYVGGTFETAGGTNVNNIALWNNNNWIALTDATNLISGTNNEIRSISFDENNNLYVGGNFGSAGGNSAARIALWNGTNWQGLGDGTSGFVQAIVVTPTHVYAGGNFAIAGSQTVNRIARWNRSSNTWQSLNNGLNGSVNSLLHDGTHLYVGGAFETASDQTDINEIMNYVARWSQSNGWEALGTNTSVGLSNLSNVLEFSNDYSQMLVGGNFTIAGQTSSQNIALWKKNSCTSDSVIPEYRLNGTWLSGESNLTVSEGTEVTLSILPNGVDFIIKLPDGNTVNDDYDLGIVNSTNSGDYIFTTEDGCTETFNLTINAIINDDDNDGVTNDNDQCPNTQNGEAVDVNGCSQSQLDDDNDGVTNDIDQCSNTPNGETVDAFGCPSSIIDGDNDSVLNSNDLCPNTPNGETVDAFGCSQSQLDDDSDGVTNDVDQCPNTPSGAQVDSSGCEIQSIKFDNYIISSVSNSCRGSNDGQIRIETQLSLNYQVTISNTNLNQSYNFTDTFMLNDLAPGTYDLCIKPTNIESEEFCSKFIIFEPEELSVFTNMDGINNTITLNMLGSSEYIISLNENSFKTNDNEVKLNLTQKINTIKVTAEKNCQGSYEETIIIGDDIKVHPNPFSEFIIIDLNRIENSDNIILYLNDLSGKEILSEKIDIMNSRIELPTEMLSKGLYILTIQSNTEKQIFKLIKN